MPIAELNPKLFYDLFHAVIRHSADDGEISRSARALEWLGTRIPQLNKICGSRNLDLLQTAWDYFQEHGSSPSLSTVQSRLLQPGAEPGVLLKLTEYQRFVPNLNAPATVLDLPEVVGKMGDDWKRVKTTELLQDAQSIVNGGLKRGVSTLLGPSDAVAYFIKQVRDGHLTSGINLGSSEPEGEWTEHTADVEKALVDRLENPFSRRIFTGLPPVDEKLAIGPGESIRFVGIVGGSNHGKSALLLPLVYNMARMGKSICLVPREYSVQDAWTRLTWLHAAQFPDIHLPPLESWKNQPQTVTPQQGEWIRFLLNDLRSKKTIRGSIDVISASYWEDIVDHLERNDEIRKYDCLAVDYIGHLATQGRASDAFEAKKQVFRAAQNLALGWRDGKGLLVITPMQANKTSVEKAGEKEGREYGTFTGNYGAVEYFTSAAQDSDLLIGIFQGKEHKAPGQAIVSCVKSRGQYFDPFLVSFDPVTRGVAVEATGDEVYAETCKAADAYADRGKAKVARSQVREAHRASEKEF